MDAIARECGTVHTVKGLHFYLPPGENLPEVLMVHTSRREEPREPIWKDGKWVKRKPYIRPEAWGWFGGTMALIDDGDFKKTLLREELGETGVTATPEMYPDGWALHFKPTESDRGKGLHQIHYYAGNATNNKTGAITETSEIIEAVFVPWNEIPYPDAKREKVLTFPSHIKNGCKLLEHLQGKREEAEYWLKMYRKRFRNYLDDE